MSLTSCKPAIYSRTTRAECKALGRVFVKSSQILRRYNPWKLAARVRYSGTYLCSASDAWAKFLPTSTLWKVYFPVSGKWSWQFPPAESSAVSCRSTACASCVFHSRVWFNRLLCYKPQPASARFGRCPSAGATLSLERSQVVLGSVARSALARKSRSASRRAARWVSLRCLSRHDKERRLS